MFTHDKRMTVAGSVAFVLLALTVAMGVVTAGAATTAMLSPTADTYSRADAPTANFGTSARWSTDGRASVTRHAYLRFEVVVPDGHRVVSATLRANSETATSSTELVNAYSTTGAWTETALTWNNAPPAVALLAQRGGFAANSWVEWNVTSAVTGSGQLNLRLQTPASKYIGFKAREFKDAAVRPQLVVVTEPSGTTPTTSAAPTTTTAAPTATASSTPTAAPTTTATAGPGPKVTLTSPTDGAILKGTITLNATSSDATRVEYFLGTTKIGEDASCCAWDEPWNSATVADGTYQVTARGTNAAGVTTTAPHTVTVANGNAPTPTTTPAPTSTAAPPPPPGPGDVTLAATGDMNPTSNTSSTSNSGRNATAVAEGLASGEVQAFLGLGDFQYDTAYCVDLVSYWNRLWGPVKPQTYWVSAPNHDWQPGRNEDLDDFMNGECAGDTGKARTNVELGRIGNGQPYAIDLGSWHIALMPTGLWRYDAAAANAATVWLDADLAAAKAAGRFLAVAYHDPYFTSATSAHSRFTAAKPWIDVAWKHRVRVLLSGSQHNYERTCPVDNADTCVTDGMTQFQVSTGGIGLRTFSSVAPYSERRITDTWGHLRLTLRADGGFAWRFHPVSGGMQTDSGWRQ